MRKSIFLTAVLTTVLISTPLQAQNNAIEAEPLVIQETKVEPVETKTEPVYPEKYSSDEIDMLAQLAMAEAEDQTELGKRLVIDTVLNRVDSPHFPDTIEGVIFQKGHFSPITDGRWEECYVQNDIRNLVLEELDERTNSDVIYFRTKRYSDYGTPLFKEDDHYFSSY